MVSTNGHASPTALTRTRSLRPRPRREGVRPADVVAVLVVVQVLLVASFALFRHATFNSGAFDLGIFDQVIWNSAFGRPFANTLSESPNFIGQHLSPILLLFTPLALVGDASTLIVAQAILLGVAALPIFWYSRRVVGGWLAVLPPLAYLVHPTTIASATFDFHEVAAGAPLIAFTLFGLLDRRPRLFLGAGLALLLVKEDCGIILAGFGLWAAWRNRWRWALIVAAVGLAWSALAVLVIIPAARGSAYQYFDRFGTIGGSPAGILGTAISNPLAVLGTVVNTRKLLFLVDLVGGFAGWPILAPAVLLLALPNLAYLLPGSYGPLTSLLSHYPLLLVPILACAMAHGLAVARRRLNRPRLLTILGSLTVLSTVVFSAQRLATLLPNRLSNGFAGDADHLAVVNELLNRIPADAAISAQTGIVPHLSRRQGIWLFPILGDANLIALDTRAQRFAVGELSYEEGLQEVVCGPTWTPILDRDGVLLLQRGLPEPGPTDATTIDRRFVPAIRLTAYEVPKRTVRAGELIRLVLYWQATDRPGRDWTVFTQLLDDDGRAVAQSPDGPPRCGDSPTSSWQAGTTTRDPHYLIPIPSITPGSYRLVTGLYDSAGSRLLVDGAETTELGRVTVTR